ncbi:MAG: S-layer homology domain-containing protein [Actinobacteria bacterium]|nr:S-layer homology domain-containing protein [Actinomycetota bacterium]
MRQDWDVPILGEPAERPEKKRFSFRLVKRIVLNLFVLAAFLGAVYTLYTLVESSGILDPGEVQAQLTFEDIPENYVQVERITTAVETGLVPAAAGTRFGPTDPMDRMELAKAVVLAMGWPVDGEAQQIFDDVEADLTSIDDSDYAAAIFWHHAMSGTGDDPLVFSPDASASIRLMLLVMGRAATEELPEADEITDAIDDLELSSDEKEAFQRLLDAEILEGTAIQPGITDLEGPVLREQLAIATVNLKAFIDRQ